MIFHGGGGGEWLYGNYFFFLLRTYFKPLSLNNNLFYFSHFEVYFWPFNCYDWERESIFACKSCLNDNNGFSLSRFFYIVWTHGRDSKTNEVGKILLYSNLTLIYLSAIYIIIREKEREREDLYNESWNNFEY